jgi:uncharacterized membrane protein
MSRLMLLIISLILLAYPLGVYFGLQYMEPRYIGLLLLIFLGMRFMLARKHLKWDNLKSLLPITVASSVLCLFILLFNHPAIIRLNPVLINVMLLITFGYTLYQPPSMIERMARLSTPSLPAQAIAYTRTVTKIWCFFFVVNGIIAAYTCFYASMETWTLYNGLIAYLLMGVLFLIEYCVRQYKMRNA